MIVELGNFAEMEHRRFTSRSARLIVVAVVDIVERPRAFASELLIAVRPVCRAIDPFIEFERSVVIQLQSLPTASECVRSGLRFYRMPLLEERLSRHERLSLTNSARSHALVAA